MSLIKKTFFFTVIALLLSACASNQRATVQQPSADQQNNSLASLGTWEIEGKIAFRGPSDNHSGYLNWQQANGTYTIRVHGPLGQGNREIIGNDNYVELRLANGTFKSDQPEQFLYQHTGWVLPINELPYWVKGQAAPIAKITHIEQDIYITELSQNDWNISYSKHQLINSIWLPGKITISKGLHKVIILAKKWKLPN
jgi:outer membrane lipoprotein LolB